MSQPQVRFLSSIRGKLTIANLSFVVVLLGVSIVSSKQFQSLGATIAIVADSAELLLRLGHVVDERESALGALRSGYAEGADGAAKAKLEALQTDLREHLGKAIGLSAGGDEKSLIDRARRQFSEAETALSGVEKLGEDERLEALTSAEDALGDAFTSSAKAKLLASKGMEARLLSVKGELKRPIVLLWGATFVGCFVAFVVFLFTNRRVARPIADLMTGVEGLSEGNLRRIEVRGEDELGHLARSFNGMAETITDKNRSLELVLDNVGDALFTVDRAGLLVGRPSLRALEWFGSPKTDATLWGYLAPENELFAFALENGFEQLIDEILPFEISADQIPREIERSGRLYSLHFREVRVETRLERVLVVVTDITEARELAEKEKRQRDRYSLASLGMRDPDAYQDFCRDTQARLERALRNENVLLELHTIKGNSGVVGCESFAEVVHQAESSLAENAPVEATLRGVEAEWQALQQESEKALGRAANEVIVVRRDQYDRLLRLTREEGRSADAHALAKSWSMHQVGSSLSRLARTAERYAEKEGKRVTVRHEGDHIAVHRGHLDELWACLSHLVKNAVAHGVEPEAERVGKGKNPVASIVVSAKVESGALHLAVADDGKGIDWRRLAEKSGRSAEPSIDLFLAGVSTANEVSELAGRGVGVAAVVEVTRSLGGTIEVESESDRGSVFKVKVPLAEDHAYAAKPSVLPGKTA